MWRKDLILLAAVVLTGAVLQLFLIAVDGRDTPGRAAVAFTKACYLLDESTLNQLCTVKQPDDEDLFADYLNGVDKKAAELGFNRDYMRMQLTNIRTDTIRRGDTTARVTVSASMKRCIHPVFTIVARLFRIGKTYQLEQTVNLVKEDGIWKLILNLQILAHHGGEFGGFCCHFFGIIERRTYETSVNIIFLSVSICVHRSLRLPVVLHFLY